MYGALRWKLDERVAVSGDMDLRGNIYSVDGLPGKLEGCRAGGVRVVLVPEPTLRYFDVSSLPTPELRQYAAVALKGYSSVADAMQAAVVGGYSGGSIGQGCVEPWRWRAGRLRGGGG